MRFAKYLDSYSQRDKHPKYWHLVLIFESIIRRGPKLALQFFWFVRANSLPEIKVTEERDLPSIELAIVSTQKDFVYLQNSIKMAVNSSLNTISNIKIVIPERFNQECRQLLVSLESEVDCNITILNEENLISQELRNQIKLFSQDYYGWVLQQFLKIKLASESTSKGVLIVDSDTLLFGSYEWLDFRGKQLLVVASTRHKPYFKILKKLNISKKFNYSFITHHMLYQPCIIQNLFNYLGCKSFDDFVIKIMNSTITSEPKNLSIDYELYGHYLKNNFQDLIKLKRFCNLSLSANSNLKIENFLIQNQEIIRKFNSLSFHSWNNSGYNK